MSRKEFKDATLVVLGHGSTQNAESSMPVYQHAVELRRRRVFGEVREAFWKQEPQVKEVLAAVSTPRVFIAPLFISDGYFSDVVIPQELGFPSGKAQLATHNSQLFYAGTIGTHRSMTGVILGRARGIVARFPFPRVPDASATTLFIAGHGTDRNTNSRQAIDRQVEWIHAMGLYGSVQGLFLEQEPRIGECYRLAPTKNLVVVPFFISDGMHTRVDIPVMMGEPRRLVEERLAEGRPTWRNPTERQGKRAWYTPAAGTDPHVADVILERVREISKGARRAIPVES